MITKEQFCESIRVIRDYWDWSMQIYKFFDTYPDSTPSMEVMDNLIDYLIRETHDKENAWIFYFCWELNFGRDYHPGVIKDKDGKFISLTTPEELWELLQKQSLPYSPVAQNDFCGIIE